MFHNLSNILVNYNGVSYIIVVVEVVVKVSVNWCNYSSSVCAGRDHHHYYCYYHSYYLLQYEGFFLNFF